MKRARVSLAAGKMTMRGGRGLDVLEDAMLRDVRGARETAASLQRAELSEPLESRSAELEEGVRLLRSVTETLRSEADGVKMLANAHDYLNFCGHTASPRALSKPGAPSPETCPCLPLSRRVCYPSQIIAWMWLRQEACAVKALGDLSEQDRSGEAGDFYRGKIMASRFFFAHELPKTKHQANLLSSFDSTTLDMKDQYF